MTVLLSPWFWLAGSAVCVGVGFVAASGWNPPRRRRRTSGETLSFERKGLGL